MAGRRLMEWLADIALFHSVLGVRFGIHDAADRLRADGHEALVMDQYDGRVFDDYDKASEFAESIGYPSLMRLVVEAVEELPDGFIPVGFSNGGAQIHYAVDDPFRNQAWIDAVVTRMQSAGARVEVFDYPGAGHLFTDRSLKSEYDEPAADLLWSRVVSFCASLSS